MTMEKSWVIYSFICSNMIGRKIDKEYEEQDEARINFYYHENVSSSFLSIMHHSFAKFKTHLFHVSSWYTLNCIQATDCYPSVFERWPTLVLAYQYIPYMSVNFSITCICMTGHAVNQAQVLGALVNITHHYGCYECMAVNPLKRRGVNWLHFAIQV